MRMPVLLTTVALPSYLDYLAVKSRQSVRLYWHVFFLALRLVGMFLRLDWMDAFGKATVQAGVGVSYC